MPSAMVLHSLAKVLQVTPAWIMTGKNGELETLTQEEEEIVHAARQLTAEQRPANARKKISVFLLLF